MTIQEKKTVQERLSRQDRTTAKQSNSQRKRGGKKMHRQLPVSHKKKRPPIKSSKSNASRDRNAARATLGKGLAVSAFPLYVPV